MRLAERALTAACWCAIAMTATTASAQHDNPDWAQDGMPPPPTVTMQDREWQESKVPQPPSFDEQRLIPIEMPPYMSLKFGVDPATLAITSDGVVRYVVVATNRSGGALNAFYEGVRCSTAEMKTYARYNGQQWDEVKNSDWKHMLDMNSNYSWALATQGLCRGEAPRISVDDIVGHLRKPIREAE